MIGFFPSFLIELGGFSLIEPPVFSPRFLFEFRRFFHLLTYTVFSSVCLLGLGGFLHQSHDLKRLHARQSSYPRGKAIVMSWSHMTSHVMDLTWSGQFYIEIDLVIHHLTYLTFRVNLSNQPFKSTYKIKHVIQSVAPLACDILLL